MLVLGVNLRLNTKVDRTGKFNQYLTNAYGEIRPTRKRPHVSNNDQFDVYDPPILRPGPGYDESEYDDVNGHVSEDSSVSEGIVLINYTVQAFLLLLLILIFE